MKKSVFDIVIENQRRFNKAFDDWLLEGATDSGKNWQIMFECVNFASLNKAKAMLKGKKNIDDVEDKAMDAAIHFMTHQILKKHERIYALGAKLEGMLLNELFGVKTRKAEDHDSLDELYESKKVQPRAEEEVVPEKMWDVEGVGLVSEAQMHDSTFVFELDWFRTVSDTEHSGQSQTSPVQRKEEELY